MAAIVTSNMRVHAATQFINGFSDSNQHHYLFIGRTLPWLNDNAPPTPIDCPVDQSASFRDMLSLKRISPSDVSLVSQRFTWTVSTVYTQYTNDVDLFDPTSNLPPFYVITESLNVYKCLNNNGGVASTVQPTGTTTDVITLADGYQWKFMFTVSSADVLKFVTAEWFPVKTLVTNDGSSQWLVQQAAVPGTLDRVEIITTGTQYTQIPTVTIVGDGTGATAAGIISGGNVISIIVTSPGQNYTWATISITGGGVSANGASAKAILSPVKGHGSDPVKELGAYFALINSKLIYDESSNFTVTNDFRKIGILKNPLLNDNVTSAVGLDYNQATRFYFGSVSGSLFNADEIVTGSTSGATGVVIDYDSQAFVLRVAEVHGSFVPGETVVGSVASGTLQTITGTLTSATSTTVVLPNGASASSDAYTNQYIKIMTGLGNGQIRKITGYVGVNRTATISPAFTVTPNGSSTFTIAKIVLPDLESFTGDILYMEHRRPIARASQQVEDIKITLQF